MPDRTSALRNLHGEARYSGLSVVVPARNAARTIAACVQALLDEIPGDRGEIIVVVNRSTDGTSDILDRFPVTVHRALTAGVSASRNFGASAGRYERLAFVDSDNVVCRGWYEALMRQLDDPSIAICGDRYSIRDNATWVERAWATAHGHMSAIMCEVEYVPGGNLAIPRKTFNELNGFDEALETGEDMDLCQRATSRGGRIVRTPLMRSIHLGEPRTLLGVARRNAWHGRGARLHYANGRLCFATVSTALFIATLSVGLAAAVAVVYTGSIQWAAGLAVPALIPAIYSARYAKRSLPHVLQLWFIYLAYFLGRALGMVLARVRQFAPGAESTG